jgi:UBA-like domain
LKKLNEREADQLLQNATTREEIKAATITKMKNVTGAKDEICVAILESNGYDLKASIEAFYLR